MNVTVAFHPADDPQVAYVESLIEAHLVPALGCATAAFVAFSPMARVRRARKEGSMGDDLSPLPWVVMAFVALVYTIYSLMTADWYLFVSSVIWMFCSAFYVVSALKLMRVPVKVLVSQLRSKRGVSYG